MTQRKILPYICVKKIKKARKNINRIYIKKKLRKLIYTKIKQRDVKSYISTYI